MYFLIFSVSERGQKSRFSGDSIAIWYNLSKAQSGNIYQKQPFSEPKKCIKKYAKIYICYKDTQCRTDISSKNCK